MNQEHTTTENIIDYLHHELGPEADAALLLHLKSCAQCAAMYEEQARLSESLRAFARASERELPQGVVARIWDAVDAQAPQPSVTQRIAAFFRPAIVVPVAAVLVVGAFFGYSATHHASPMITIDAAYYLRDHASINNTMPFGESSVEPTSLRSDESASDQQWVASTGASAVAETR
ncbi:MAG: zf-HC2 domain-containing protein [Candidatus Eremiobacteraeota bacterium]|nr:zf-HC2 domain-containing protein [Candidatus Eremiobacteraeota bacterium]